MTDTPETPPRPATRPATRPARPETRPGTALREAFRALHAQRLYGFALLVTIGDRRLAAQLTADALAAGAARAGSLRHPERAAAWLRERVARGAAVVPRTPDLASELARRAAVEPLGMPPPALAGLAALPPRERAAIVAASIERLGIRDVGTVLETDARGAARIVSRARRRYLRAFSVAFEASEPPPRGPIADRVNAIVERALS